MTNRVPSGLSHLRFMCRGGCSARLKGAASLVHVTKGEGAEQLGPRNSCLCDQRGRVIASFEAWIPFLLPLGWAHH